MGFFSVSVWSLHLSFTSVLFQMKYLALYISPQEAMCIEEDLYDSIWAYSHTHVAVQV